MSEKNKQVIPDFSGLENALASDFDFAEEENPTVDESKLKTERKKRTGDSGTSQAASIGVSRSVVRKIAALKFANKKLGRQVFSIQAAIEKTVDKEIRRDPEVQSLVEKYLDLF